MNSLDGPSFRALCERVGTTDPASITSPPGHPISRVLRKKWDSASHAREGHDFSRAAKPTKNDPAFSPDPCQRSHKARPSQSLCHSEWGAKPHEEPAFLSHTTDHRGTPFLASFARSGIPRRTPGKGTTSVVPQSPQKMNRAPAPDPCNQPHHPRNILHLAHRSHSAYDPFGPSPRACGAFA